MNPMQPIADIQTRQDQFLEAIDAMSAAIANFVETLGEMIRAIMPLLVAAIKNLVSIYRAGLVEFYYGPSTGMRGLVWRVLRYPRRVWHRWFGHSGIIDLFGGYDRACDTWVNGNGAEV